MTETPVTPRGTAPDYWPSDHAGMRVLPEDACLRLLGSHQVGRLAFLADGEVEIFPVTFTVDGEAVVFRTGVGTKLGAALERAVVAFEVDGVDEETRSGWSVVVKGVCEEVQDPGTLGRLAALGFTTWLEHPRAGGPFRWVRISPYSVTGRALPQHHSA
jgi:hypothetical protein